MDFEDIFLGKNCMYIHFSILSVIEIEALNSYLTSCLKLCDGMKRIRVLLEIHNIGNSDKNFSCQAFALMTVREEQKSHVL